MQAILDYQKTAFFEAQKNLESFTKIEESEIGDPKYLSALLEEIEHIKESLEKMKSETIIYMDTQNAIIDKNYYANSKFLLEAFQGECIFQSEIIHQKI